MSQCTTDRMGMVVGSILTVDSLVVLDYRKNFFFGSLFILSAPSLQERSLPLVFSWRIRSFDLSYVSPRSFQFLYEFQSPF